MLLYLLGEKRKSRLPSVRLSLLLINQTTTFKELLNRLYYSPVQDKRYHDHYVFVFVLYYRDFTAPNYVFTIISLSLQQRTLFIYSTFLPFIFITTTNLLRHITTSIVASTTDRIRTAYFLLHKLGNLHCRPACQHCTCHVSFCHILFVIDFFLDHRFEYIL